MHHGSLISNQNSEKSLMCPEVELWFAWNPANSSHQFPSLSFLSLPFPSPPLSIPAQDIKPRLWESWLSTVPLLQVKVGKLKEQQRPFIKLLRRVEKPVTAFMLITITLWWLLSPLLYTQGNRSTTASNTPCLSHFESHSSLSRTVHTCVCMHPCGPPCEDAERATGRWNSLALFTRQHTSPEYMPPRSFHGWRGDLLANIHSSSAPSTKQPNETAQMSIERNELIRHIWNTFICMSQNKWVALTCNYTNKS